MTNQNVLTFLLTASAPGFTMSKRFDYLEGGFYGS